MQQNNQNGDHIRLSSIYLLVSCNSYRFKLSKSPAWVISRNYSSSFHLSSPTLYNLSFIVYNNLSLFYSSLPSYY